MPEHVVTRAELHDTVKRLTREYGTTPTVERNSDDTYTIRYVEPVEPPLEIR